MSLGSGLRSKKAQKHRQPARRKIGIVFASYQPQWDAEEYLSGIDENDMETKAASVLVTWMRLDFHAHVSEQDACAVAGEYARKTCAEPNILRCDALVANGVITVWTVFSDDIARASHEIGAAAAQLRLSLAPKERPHGRSEELARLAAEFRSYKIIWPRARNAWRSSLSSAISDNAEAVTGGNVEGWAGRSPIRNENIDCENIRSAKDGPCVLIARARVAEEDYADDVNDLCVRYARERLSERDSCNSENSLRALHRRSRFLNDVIRVSVLRTVGDASAITVCQVSTGASSGASDFDVDLAAELLDSSGWSIEVHTTVFPDLRGWHIVDLNDYPWNSPGYEEVDSWQKTLDDGSLGERVDIGQAYEEQQSRLAENSKETGTAAYAAVAGEMMAGGVVGARRYDRLPSSFPHRFDRKPAPSFRDDLLSTSILEDSEEVSEAAEASSGSESSSESLGLRVLLGNDAFSEMERKLRQLCGKGHTSVMRVFAVSGWNEARLQPLVLEMDAGMDAARVEFCVGLNVFGASPTIAKVAAGVASARKFGADVVVGFGGGAVMDVAKAISFFLATPSGEVSAALSNFRVAIDSGRDTWEFPQNHSTVPVALVASTIGSGAEVCDQAILSAHSR